MIEIRARTLMLILVQCTNRRPNPYMREKQNHLLKQKLSIKWLKNTTKHGNINNFIQ